MKLWKKGLLLMVLGLAIAGGKVQVQAAETPELLKSSEVTWISNYEGTTVTVDSDVKSIFIDAHTSSIEVIAPSATHITITDSYNSDAPCETVDLSACTNAESVVLSLNNMTSFNLPTNGGKIKDLDIWSSKIKNLNLPTIKNLTSLSVGGSALTSINLQTLTKLETLSISDADKLTKIDISKSKKLKKLICGSTALKSIDTSKNTNLELISLKNTNLTSIDCTKNTKLTALQCYSGKLTSLKVGAKNTKLKEVSCQDNKLKKLDLSKASNVKTVNCYGNPLKTLQVKSTSNCLKKVKIGSQISDISAETYTTEWGYERNRTTITLEDNSKIKKYLVFVQNTDSDEWDFTYNISGSQCRFPSATGQQYKIRTVSGVNYKNTTIYFEDSTQTITAE
jgi:hypothetical protein